MKINILVPGRGAQASGGLKVLYRHANGLATLGHDVTLVHTPFRLHDAVGWPQVKGRLSYWAGRSGLSPWRPDGWFHLDDRVACMWLPSLDERSLPRADATLASFWHNADWLCDAGPRAGTKYYLVQELEYFMTANPPTRARMQQAFRSGLKLLSISPAVTRMLRDSGAKVEIHSVPNGIEHETFYQTLDLSDVQRNAVGFPARAEEFKATPDAVRALTRVKAAFPALRIWSFGWKRLSCLPPWVEFHQAPSVRDLRALYNESLAFLVPSRYEGWGLPGAEAMACGAALVSTDNLGVRAYAQSGETAVLVPPGDVTGLAREVQALLSEPARREQLARKGHAAIRAFTWSQACARLHEVLTGRDRSAVTPTRGTAPASPPRPPRPSTASSRRWGGCHRY